MNKAQVDELEGLARLWNERAYIECELITIVNSVGLKMRAVSIGLHVRGGTSGVLIFEVHAQDEGLAARVMRRGIQDLISRQAPE